VKSPVAEAASEPSARRLIEDLAGALFVCNTYRDEECPTGKVEDITACVNVDPVTSVTPKVAGSLGPRSVDHLGQGNGCPQQRSFDVIAANGSPDFGTTTPDELYVTASTTSGPDAFASVATDAADVGGTPVLNFRIVTDGLSIHYRRDEGGDCDFTTGLSTSVTERMSEVLTFLGHGEGGTQCFDPTTGTGVPGDTRQQPAFRTALANFAPNPLLTGLTGRIQFTMEREGAAQVDIFDVNGRLVKNVYDGIASAGPNEVSWNGTDVTGRQVASGVYFYRLRANAEDFSKQMVVVRNGGN
jgi:hypothetical protein